ncbi:hypothetical protein STASHLEY_00640 [Brevundimonas phage vB_BpoS-StAshley]|nr:hypothetical protein STASHLEY_00640 [Brevundimonas phage vB_BpoS-StAshley]UTC30071.1 hypothetical protein MAINES_00320 [Brevundimonas phage vB_BpoS-MaInes]
MLKDELRGAEGGAEALGTPALSCVSLIGSFMLCYLFKVERPS